MITDENSIRTVDFLTAVLYILRESFEGSPEGEGSAYLDQRVGIFDTLDSLSAEDVSGSHASTTIAAHTEHTKFYVDRLTEFIEGRTEPVNWEQSWLIETVNSEEWKILRDGMRISYKKLLGTLSDVDQWSEDRIGEAVAIVAHTAYHLGAIRQLSKLVPKKRAA